MCHWRKCVTWLLSLWAMLEQPALILAQPNELEAEELPPGIVIVVGGVGGMDLLGLSAPLAFKHKKVPHEILEFEWTHGRGQVLKDLQDTQHLHKKAAELAQLIRRLRAENPRRPIYLIAKSGGTGLVLRAAGLLPAGSLERIILLSAAVSPHYDLRDALRATRREIVSFSSPHDQLILNWGTRQFGTIDRYYGPSAGLKGFLAPEGQDEEGQRLYRRLVQIPYHRRMLRHGYTGTHSGTSYPTFLAEEVVPWLR